MKYIGIFFLVILYFYPSFSAREDKCKFEKCGDCISSIDNCVWCSEEKNQTTRCRPFNSLSSTEQWCKNEFIENATSIWEKIRNYDFSAGENGTNVVQFRPQHIKFTGRPGQSIPIQMSYQPAQHYPLDVYYLMDNSFTMETHVHALKDQASLIYSELTKITNNVRLGVGSFIEKPAFPYFDKNTRDALSYVFKNNVNLTDDTTLFQSAINNIKFGSNYDDPEAGLDALMQVMACKKELGWREKSRKFIVLCTDSSYHSAGDGKMIGIIKPNDMQCHFDDNKYSKELELDYPSVSQINKVAREGGFQIIFAVVNHTNEYTALAKQIVGASYAPLSNEDKSSVVNIIIKAYTDAVSYVELDGKLPKNVELTLDPDCRKKTKDEKGCGITHTDANVTINGILTIKSCDGVHQETGEIGPVGLTDKLIIDINYICQCDCEKRKGPLSSQCNNAGARQCGLCECVPPSYGSLCQCNGTSSDSIDTKMCRLNNNATKLCSGRGTCMCGKCGCEDGYSGDFCEFDDKVCPQPNKQLCSGHGICRFGGCQCKEGWTHDDCSCPVGEVSDDYCTAPRSQNVCSGNGVCVCGVCQCNKIEGKNETYSGVFCDTCDECAEKRCRELEDYVYCNYLNNKTICDQQYNANATDVMEVTLLNKTEINGPEWYPGKWCKKLLDDGSYIVFKYKYNGTALVIAIQNEPELPPKANIWIAVGSAVGAVLLIGLLTVVIWKILIDMHDEKEYNKFAKQSKAAGFDVSRNPLYESPATKFSNPAYTGNM